MNTSLYIQEALEADTWEISWRFTVGAAGALSNTTPARNKGIKSGTTLASLRTGAGTYLFPLAGTIPGGLLSGSGGIIGTFTSTDGTNGIVTTDNSKATSSPSVTVTFYPTGSQTATDIKSGVDMWINLIVKNGVV